MPITKSFYFKAYDQVGHKRTGTIESSDAHAADAALRKDGLRPYFVLDHQTLKKLLRRKTKQRRLTILALGSAAIVASVLLAGLIITYAGRERPPDVEQLRKTGIVDGYPTMMYSETSEGREFGTETRQIWDSFCPNTVTGLDVGKLLMTVYVTRAVRKLSPNELEALASGSARALQRRFGATTSTVLVVEDDQTILEVRYDSLSRSVHVKSYE